MTPTLHQGHAPSGLSARRTAPPGVVSASGARLAALKAAPRKSGEASFFFYDSHFHSEAVKVLPGEYFVSDDDILIMTTLGSCIAACIWDRERGIGGMNHFMLPEGSGDSGRYGSYAMEVLINEILKAGGSRMSLEAKVFGGGAVISGMSSINVGERNTRFVLDYLKTERIPVVSKDVLDIYPRKVCFLAASGKAMVKRLASGNTEALLAQEQAAARRAAVPASTGGSVDLF
jgi:chemotaxis protein CheD